MTNTAKYAVITGASKGLGKAFARELAATGKNLILVSLPGEGLNGIGGELKTEFGVDVACYETDFNVDENILKFTDWVNENFQVEILINNAGIGGSKSFTEASNQYLRQIIQLNITSPVILLHKLLPNLLKQERSWILNVASMASFSPMGFKTVYPASKRFIHHFSRGLHEELKNTGITISCVFPGPMRTNTTVSNRIEKYGIWGRLILMTPEQVASKSIRRMMKNDRNIILGWPNKFYWFMMTKFPPGIVLQVATRFVKNELIREKQQAK